MGRAGRQAWEEEEEDGMSSIDTCDPEWFEVMRRAYEEEAYEEAYQAALVNAELGQVERDRYIANHIREVRGRSLRWDVLERDDFRCLACGTGQNLCVAYNITLRNGGEASLENLLTLCRRCQRTKGRWHWENFPWQKVTPAPSFEVGQRVWHQRLRAGTVLKVWRHGPELEVQVLFDYGERVRFDAKRAELAPLVAAVAKGA